MIDRDNTRCANPHVFPVLLGWYKGAHRKLLVDQCSQAVVSGDTAGCPAHLHAPSGKKNNCLISNNPLLSPHSAPHPFRRPSSCRPGRGAPLHPLPRPKRDAPTPAAPSSPSTAWRAARSASTARPTPRAAWWTCTTSGAASRAAPRGPRTGWPAARSGSSAPSTRPRGWSTCAAGEYSCLEGLIEGILAHAAPPRKALVPAWAGVLLEKFSSFGFAAGPKDPLSVLAGWLFLLETSKKSAYRPGMASLRFSHCCFRTSVCFRKDGLYRANRQPCGPLSSTRACLSNAEVKIIWFGISCFMRSLIHAEVVAALRCGCGGNCCQSFCLQALREPLAPAAAVIPPTMPFEQAAGGATSGLNHT